MSKRLLLALFGWLLLAGTAHAQNAQMAGTVTDQTGGVVPGVTVTARNQETGFLRAGVTDADGSYRLPALPPGTYTLTVELPGFSTESRADIVLVIDQTANINFTMKPAAVSESVTVSGEAPIVDTSRSDVSTSVSTDQIQSLPVASRRWIDLAMLTPGVSQDAIRGRFYPGTVNIGSGTREYSNAYYVDGVNNTWAEMGEPRQNFAMDSIREFKVSTSNYKAEYGLATGGLLTVVSKAGTNEVRGSGFLFFRDKSLTARTHFERGDLEKPPFKRYQYGGTIGGPIIKDKTHYFFAIERTDEDVPFTVATGGIWPQYDGTYIAEQVRWVYTGKVDHQLNANQSLFFRLAKEGEYRPYITAGGIVAPSAGFDFEPPRTSAVVGHTWVMTDRILNDFRFQYAFASGDVEMPGSHRRWKPGDFSQERLSYCTEQFSYPTLRLGSCNSQMGPEWRFQFKDDVALMGPDWGGRHQWKFGVDYSYIDFQHDSTGGFTGNWTFPKDEVYNPNDRSTWPIQYTQSLPNYADIPVHHFSVYAQDDWDVAPGLVLNLGLRWDLQVGVFNENIPALMEKIEEKLGPGFGFPIPVPFHDKDPLTGSPNSERGDFNNFGPRVGLAWDPFRTGRTNIHAGYGMFYDNIRHLQNFSEIRWPQSKQIIIRNPSYPDALQGRPREQFISTAPPNINVLSNDMVNGYAHQYSAGITQLVARSFAVTADLTWVDSFSDNSAIDVNLPDRVTRQRPYPQFGRVTYRLSESDNTFRALLLKLEKRMSDGYQFLVSYTHSKASDSILRNALGDVYGYSRVDSPAVADRRHRVVMSGIVQLPYGIQLSAIGDLRSSLPFNPATSFDINNDGYTGDNAPGVTYQSGCRDLDLAAVNAFRATRNLPAVSEGDIACPGFANVDVRLSKTFALRGSQRIEFIAQLFNVFNRANFAVPQNNIGSALFGRVTQIMENIKAPSRQVELALRYQF
jgi:outer membrane receptor protein involved in Fe transport